MENQIQQEIIRAVINARNKGKDIKQTIKALAKEFALTEFVVKGIIETSATYAMEQIQGPKAAGKKWVPLNHTKAIKRLEDKIYELQAEIVKINNRISRELGIREDSWNNTRNKSSVEIPKGTNRIQELRKKIDEVRALLDEEQEEEPRLRFTGIKEGKKAIPG